jgi:hypothetical protein
MPADGEKRAAEGRRERAYPEGTCATEDIVKRRFAAARRVRDVKVGIAIYLFSLPRRRPRTISLSDSLCLRRVRLPSVGTPHGVTG